MFARNLAIVAVLGTGLFASAGCESLGLGGDSSSSSRDRDRISDRRDRTRSDDRVIGREPERAVGGGMSSIPTTATRVESGRDQRLSYEAERSGRIYLFDVTDDRVVHSGRVQSGDRFTFDPRDGAMLNGRALDTTPNVLPRDHDYRVYFDREVR